MADLQSPDVGRKLKLKTTDFKMTKKTFQRIALTGVSGFIGRTLATQMSRQGYTVAGIDICSPENSGVNHVATYHQIELPSPRFGELLQTFRPDVLLHCAGRASVPHSMTDPNGDFEQGPRITASILEQVRIQTPKAKVLFCSSAAVYGEASELPIAESAALNPISPYGFNKSISEVLCKQYYTCFGVKSAIMRIFSAYGPGLRRQVIYDICKQSLQSSIRLQGTGEETRDFIHVQDIAKAALAIIEHAGFEGDVFNVASGEEKSIREIAEIAARLSTPSPLIRYDAARQPGMPQRWVADITKLNALGFEASIDIEAGIKSVLNWCNLEGLN
jgi:UDP-glucose 4-epimerase